MFKHNAMFTDTCDCCGFEFQPWLLMQTKDGGWCCAACLDETAEAEGYVDDFDED